MKNKYFAKNKSLSASRNWRVHSYSINEVNGFFRTIAQRGKKYFNVR